MTKDEEEEEQKEMAMEEELLLRLVSAENEIRALTEELFILRKQLNYRTSSSPRPSTPKVQKNVLIESSPNGRVSSSMAEEEVELAFKALAAAEYEIRAAEAENRRLVEKLAVSEAR